MMIRGVALDLAGVLYVGEKPPPGAHGAIENLKRAGLATRFINTTRSARRTVLDSLNRMGLPIAVDTLFIAPLAARR